MFRHSWILVVLLAVSTIGGCGGGGGGSAATTPTPPIPTPAGPSPVNSPTVVSVAAGQSATGVDINVASTVSTTPLNAQLLGVNPVGSGGSASNVGGTIGRGTTMKIVIFGPGLDSNTVVSIGRPDVGAPTSSDITVSNVVGIMSQATTGSPSTTGISFTAAAAGNAALGARTVYMRNSNNEITTFTGGLEVIP